MKRLTLGMLGAGCVMAMIPASALADCAATNICAHTATQDGLAPPPGSPAGTYAVTYSGTQANLSVVGFTDQRLVQAGTSITTGGTNTFQTGSGGKLYLDGTSANRILISNGGASSAPAALRSVGGNNSLIWAIYTDITLTGVNNSRGAYGGINSNPNQTSATVLDHVRINQAGTGSGHVTVVSENGRVYVQDSDVVNAGSGQAFLTYIKAGDRIDAVRSHAGELAANSQGVLASGSTLVFFDDGAVYTRGANSNALLAQTAGTKLYANGNDIATGVRLGANSADWTTYGRPVDTAGNLIIDPALYVASGTAGSAAVLARTGGLVTLGVSASTGKGNTVTTLGNTSEGLLATGAGSSIVSDSTTIRTAGANSFGAHAQSGSTITLTNGSIATAGASAHGVMVESGSSVTATGVAITASGANASALFMTGTGATQTASFTNSALTSGSGATIAASVGTNNVTLTGGSVTNSANGDALASNGGTLTVNALNGATILGSATTAAGSATNLSMSGGSLWTVTGPSTVSSLSLDASTVRYGAATTLSVVNPITLGAGGGTIDTNGFNPAALSTPITGAGALTKAGVGTLTLTGTNTYTGGTTITAGTLQLGDGGTSGSIVGNVTDNGTLAFNRSDVVTYSGAISGSGSVNQIGNGTSIFTGTNTYTGGTTISAGVLQLGDGGATGSVVGDIVDNGTLVLNRSGALTLNGAISGSGALQQTGTGTTALTGTNTYTGGTTITAGTLQLGDGGTSGSIVGDVANDGTLAFKRSDTVTFAGAISGTGAVNQIGTGTTVLTAANANTYSGPTTVAAGTLQAGAANTLSPNSAVTVADGATLNLVGFNQTVAGLTNAGLVNFGTGTAPGTLLTTSNYVGNGGTLAMNAVLGNDASVSDKLVIDSGTATGNTGVRVTNAGGDGARTTGNGILLINAIQGATTASDAFILAAPAVAGPYEYTLYRGSTDASAPDNWYLRSTLDCSLQPNATICRRIPPPDNYRIETSLDAALPSMALRFGGTLLDTLHERIGEERDGRRVQDEGRTGLGWARVIGRQGKERGDKNNNIYGDGPAYRYGFFGVQAGADLYRREQGDGARDLAGAYVSVGGAEGTVTHFDGKTGKDSFMAYGLGGYWTHFAANGAYIDGQVMLNWYDQVTATANRGLASLNTEGYGLGASVEGGLPFKFDQGYFIEPQAQLVYQHLDLNSAKDNGARVSFDNADSFSARLGARFGRTWTTEAGRLRTAWLRPSFWHEFMGDPKTKFSTAGDPLAFKSDMSGTRFELNAGLSGQFTRATELFVNLTYDQSLDTSSTYAYAIKAGLRSGW